MKFGVEELWGSKKTQIYPKVKVNNELLARELVAALKPKVNTSSLNPPIVVVVAPHHRSSLKRTASFPTVTTTSFNISGELAVGPHTNPPTPQYLLNLGYPYTTIRAFSNNKKRKLWGRWSNWTKLPVALRIEFGILTSESSLFLLFFFSYQV